jgi:ABC-type dipeptide/oligopeptide/nickel transport system ATPase subunit
MPIEIIRLDSISKCFKKREGSNLLFSALSFSINSDDRIAIIGASGSGKTTLGKIIAGFEKPDSGSVWIHGHPESGRPLKSIQFVFQNPFESLTPHFCIRDVLLDPFKGPQRVQALKWLEILLSRLKLNQRHLEAYPHILSGGEAQRIALLRALLLQPKVLICDEVLSAVDGLLQRDILNLIDELQKEMGFALIWITHDILIAKQFCNKFYLLDSKKFMEISSFLEDNPDEIDEGYLKELLQSMNWVLGDKS